MLNQRPIFIDAMAGSGTNLLWNILQSHASVCSPVWETHELFQRGPRGRLRGRILAALSGQPRFLDRGNLGPRGPLTRWAAGFVDLCLFQGKLRTLADPDNALCTPGQLYTEAQVRAARLVAKNLDGLVLAAPALSRIYPQACFIGLVRNGLALCESALRRGTVATAREAAGQYVAVTRRLLANSRAVPRYSLVRFEQLLTRPARFVETVYRAAGLVPTPNRPLRLKAREHYTAQGVRGSQGPVGQKRWINPGALPHFLQPRVDALQTGQLSLAQRQEFLAVAGDLMRELGYGV